MWTLSFVKHPPNVCVPGSVTRTSRFSQTKSSFVINCVLYLSVTLRLALSNLTGNIEVDVIQVLMVHSYMYHNFHSDGTDQEKVSRTRW